MGILGDVRELFEEAQACEALQDGEAFTRTLIFWSCQQGVMQSGKLNRLEEDAFAPEALAENAAATLLCGWGAPAAALAEARRVAASYPFASSFPSALLRETP